MAFKLTQQGSGSFTDQRGAIRVSVSLLYSAPVVYRARNFYVDSRTILLRPASYKAIGGSPTIKDRDCNMRPDENRSLPV